MLLAGAEYGVAAGQACVFYAGVGPRARVLGGGWIEARRAERGTGPQGRTVGGICRGQCAGREVRMER